VEIYSKKDLIKYHPTLYNFIYRKELTKNDISELNKYLSIEIDMINNYGKYKSLNGILSCGLEQINMKNEISINII
jgi:hypothetical protein